jgi:hypothetical protein
MSENTIKTIDIPPKSSLFVVGSCTLKAISGKVEHRGKLLSDSREFKDSCDYMFDSLQGGKVLLITESSWFIIENHWIEDLHKHSCLPIPSVQYFVSETPYIVETLQVYYQRNTSHRQKDTVQILDLRFSSDHFTPLNTIGFNTGAPIFFCKPKTSVEVLEKIWQAVSEHLIKFPNIPVIIHAGSFKSCNDAYSQFRQFLKMFRVQHVLISDDDRCFYTQRSVCPKMFTRLAPYQKCRVQKKIIPEKKIEFDMSNVKGVIFKSVYPPKSCLPLGDYTILMKPVYIDTFEFLQSGQSYGVACVTDLDPLLYALPITGIIQIHKNNDIQVVSGYVSSSEVYLIE